METVERKMLLENQKNTFCTINEPGNYLRDIAPLFVIDGRQPTQPIPLSPTTCSRLASYSSVSKAMDDQIQRS